MADQVNELARSAVRAWTIVARAWMEAANAIIVSWLDLPAVERGTSGFNEEVVRIPAQSTPTALHPGHFADSWDENQLPPDGVTVVPPQIRAGAETEVAVRVLQPERLASGTYVGSLLDSPDGNSVVDEISIYVVGGRAP